MTTPEPLTRFCGVCHFPAWEPGAIEIKVRAGYGSDYGQVKRTELWHRPCAERVLAANLHECIWLDAARGWA